MFIYYFLSVENSFFLSNTLEPVSEPHRPFMSLLILIDWLSPSKQTNFRGKFIYTSLYKFKQNENVGLVHDNTER